MNKNEEKHLIDIFSEIFNYANEDGYSLSAFVQSFFTSDIASEIFDCSDIVFFNPITIYKDFVKYEFSSKQIANEKLSYVIVRYIAFIYVKFILRTNENFESILKQLPVEDVINQFETIHTLSEEIVIKESKISYNLKMNPIRKLRIKTSLPIDFESDTKCLYIAKQIYLKLFDYPEFHSLRFGYFQGVECLQNETSMLYSAKIETKEQIQEIIDIRVLEYIRFNKANTVLFVFDENNSIAQKDIEELFYGQKYVPYKELLVFSNYKIKYISNGAGYLEFFIPITSLDIRRIDESYKCRFKIHNK